jgi:hypothetical protein
MFLLLKRHKLTILKFGTTVFFTPKTLVVLTQ